MTEPHIFTISELNRSARTLLESHFSSIWVTGEISNLACPASGHWYFSLKDKSAQIRCAFFRMYNTHVPFTPENGMQVIVRAKVSVYEARGDYQLIVEQMEETGLGALQRAFEQLKEKLSKEGLFDAAHKKKLPAFPKCIGVITSPTGAAIRDILSVLKRRYPLAPVIVYPTLVQGEGAAAQIVQKIELANARAECDVLLLARGGGSLEDLWPFNEEMVARAVFHSKIPIVSGVGHEIDFTIADFVADQRAPTPSAAAELISPDQYSLLQLIIYVREKLAKYVTKHLQEQHRILDWLKKRLVQCHPITILQQQHQRLDQLRIRLNQCHPMTLLQQKNQQLNQLGTRLQQNIQNTLSHTHHRLQLCSKTLHAMSPLATLDRGYAILTNAQGKAIHQSDQVSIGEDLTARLAHGRLTCTVKEQLD